MKESLCDDFMNSKKVLYPFFLYANDYLMGRTAFVPWAVEIHPTAKCNEMCIHCSYKERNENRAELDEETFDALIDSLIAMKVRGVFFSGGGEPCLYRRLKDAVVKLKENGIEVAIITNGSLFETAGLIDVADHLNYIAVSVPSCRPEMFRHITGRDYLERVLALPEKIRARHGDRSPIVGTRVVITNLIVEEVVDIHDTLKAKQFDYANFKIVRDYESRGLGVSDEAVEALKKRIEVMKKEGRIDHRFTNIDKIFDYRAPYTPKKTCHMNQMGLLAAITPEGDVYHNISEIGKEGFLIGNLHDMPLHRLWNSPAHEAVKQRSNELWRSGMCRNCRSIAFNQRIDEVLENLPEKMDPFI